MNFSNLSLSLLPSIIIAIAAVLIISLLIRSVHFYKAQQKFNKDILDKINKISKKIK